MKLADLPDDFTPAQFRQLDRESLDAVPYALMKWLCQCKGCTNGTKIRDYGIGWYWIHRNSKSSRMFPGEYWTGRNNYWLCGKHNRLFKRLNKSFDFQRIWDKFIDAGKEVRIPLDDLQTTMNVVKQIE